MTRAAASPLLALAGGSASGSAEQLLDRHAVLLLSLNAGVLLLGLACAALLLLRLRGRPVDWSRRVADLVWRPVRERDIAVMLLVIASSLTLARFAMPPVIRWASALGWDRDALALIAGSVALQGVALVAVAVLLRRRRVTWGGAFGMSLHRLPAGFVRGALLLLASVPVIFFYTLLYRFALQAAGLPVGLQDEVEIIAATNSWAIRLYFIFLAAVLAPLIEELLFRGMLFPVLLQRLPLWASVVVVSFLFALMHDHAASFASLFILSGAFCLAYLATGSLWVPIVMHGLFNLSSVAVLYLLP